MNILGGENDEEGNSTEFLVPVATASAGEEEEDERDRNGFSLTAPLSLFVLL